MVRKCVRVSKASRQRPDFRNPKKIGVRLQLKQLNPKTSHCQRKQAKANDRDEDTGQQGGPEPDARQQKRKGQEHRQSGDDIPKGVPSVIGNFLCRLFFYVKPDQRQHRHQRKRCYQTTQFVTALCRFRNQNDDCGSNKIFCDEPGQDLI